MRIIDQNALGSTSSAKTGETSSVGRGDRDGGAKKASAAGSDSVELSGFAGQLSKTLQANSSSRAQHVSQLAESVRSGTYKVDAGAVSRAMVEHSLSASSSKGLSVS